MSVILRFSIKNPLDGPDAFTLDFGSNGFLALGETLIAGATVTTQPTDLIVNGVTQTGTTITAWLSAGTANTDYVIAYSFVTTLGRHDVRSAALQVGPI